MNKICTHATLCVFWIGALASPFVGGVVSAHESEDARGAAESRVRYEVSLGAHTWQGLDDVRVSDGSRFDETGFNIGGAIHWPVGTLANGDLLLGAAMAIHWNESDIRLFTENLSFRDLYIGPSLKWVAGRRHRYSVDLGLTYHDVDIAELAGSYPNNTEVVIWNGSAFGVFVGGTLDINTSRSHGMLLALRAHFVELDIDGGDPLFAQRFRPGGRSVSGPIVSLTMGYRWR